MRVLPRLQIKLLIATVALVNLAACGGGGGGSSISNPANLSLEVVPARIDTGDRAHVRVFVSDLDPLGVAVKVRYPIVFKYIRASAFFTSGGLIFDQTPRPEASDSTHTYLVFYVPPTMLAPSGHGYLDFDIEGIGVMEDAPVQVDADIDDPNEDNSVEFDISDPLFDAQDEVKVDVEGESSSSSSSSSGSSASSN